MRTLDSGPDAHPLSLSSVVLLAGFVLIVFCTGTAEYLVAGVLPQLAADLSVDVPTAGQTVTAYALGVAVGGPIVTALTVRLPRKGLTLGLGVVFVMGLLLTAFAPGYGWIILGRVVSACCQATLFAIGLVTVVRVVGEARQGRGIAIVSSGLTVATVLGVPLGAVLGGHTSWRIPFLIVAAAGGVAVALLAVSMPRAAIPVSAVGAEIRALLRRPVLLAVATTAIGFAGVSVVFTYLVPLLTDITGMPADLVPILLLIYGIGGFVGNLVAGRLADLSLGKTLVGVFLALVLTLAAVPLAAGSVAPMVCIVLVLGLLSTSTIAPLQALVLRDAGGVPTLALTVNVSAFNLANAIGSAVGGFGIASGLLPWNGFVGAGFAALGLVFAGLALRSTR